jgi:hypothetical protein
MNIHNDFYLCKNLFYWDTNELRGYVCTITGKGCSCQGTECMCSSYDEELEE